MATVSTAGTGNSKIESLWLLWNRLFEKLKAIVFPFTLHHYRQAIYNNIQKAADCQPDNKDEKKVSCRKLLKKAGNVYNQAVTLDNRTKLEDGQVHGDNQSTNQYTQNRHDDRFEQRSQRIDRIVDFGLVEIGNLCKHIIE